MAYLLLDSANGGDGAGKWDTYSPGSISAGVTPSLRNAYSFAGNNDHQLIKSLSVASCLVGWKGWIYALTGDGSSNNAMFQVGNDDAGIPQLTLGVTATGAVTMRLGGGDGTVIEQTSGGVISIETWHDYEVRTVFHGSTGRSEVWVDGVKVIDFTGDTINTGTGTLVGGIKFSRLPALASTWRVAEVVISDGTTPLGPTSVWDSLPVGNGNSSVLTGSDGNSVDNYLLVDEATPDDDTTYVEGDTEGQIDTYAMADLPVGNWNVLAVQTALHMRKATAGTRFARPILRTGAANFVGTSIAVAASYSSHTEIFENNPDTALPWTEAEVDGLEVGLEIRDT